MFTLRVLLLAALACAAMDCGAPPASVIVNDFGDAGAGNCTTTCTLRDAISTALASIPPKAVAFSAAAGWPQTIALTQGQLSVNNTTGSIFLVLGPGAAKLAVSANNLSRVLQVSAGTNDVSGMTLRDGKVAGTSPGTESAGSGNPGQGGGAALGGCIAIDASATLTLDISDVRNCVALGGTGGTGGSGDGSGSVGGVGGSGGVGGTASGGGIYSAGNLSLIRSSLVNADAISGSGGNGGDGGSATFGTGAGGNGGVGGLAAGAAIAMATGGSLLIRNTTLASATATAGDGGKGGNGGVFSKSGNGGNGGNATGGLLYVAGSVIVADLEFATLVNGTIVAGGSGLPGFTGNPIGAGGLGGNASGAGIYATGPNSVTATSSLSVGAPAMLQCYGFVAAEAGSVNLDSDSSCPGFTLHDSVAHVLAPLNLATTN